MLRIRLAKCLTATALAGAAGMLGCLPAAADLPALPSSLADAVRTERADALPRTAFYDTPSLAGTKPGDLLRKEAFSGYQVPTGATAVRILYHSLSASGADVATSGVVLIPSGKPPAGGWPVIAWAHGTSGVARMCAPSLEKDVWYGEEGLMPMVRAGFAVVATDYHGLGTVGPHEYVTKLAQGHDVIYSIPAARAAVPALGRRWVVVGHSQGGVAAWGVAEMEASLKDPDYLGAVSVSGAAELRSILEGLGEPDSSATYYLAYMAYAIHAQSPDFKPSQMLDGIALQRYESVTTKGCWNYAYASFLDRKGGKVLKPDWEQHDAVKKFFHGDELGSSPIGGPLLVITGEADETEPFPLVKRTVNKACDNGVALTFRSYPGLDHDPTMDKSTPDQLDWIKDRFAGEPASSNCGVLSR